MKLISPELLTPLLDLPNVEILEVVRNNGELLIYVSGYQPKPGHPLISAGYVQFAAAPFWVVEVPPSAPQAMETAQEIRY